MGTIGSKLQTWRLRNALDDEVIIPAPYWVSYPEMVRLAGTSATDQAGQGGDIA